GRWCEDFGHRAGKLPVAENIPARYAPHDRRSQAADDPSDPAFADGVAAIGARLRDRIDGTIVETGRAERLLGRRDRHDFGMLGDVTILRNAVPSLAYDHAPPCDDRAEGILPLSSGLHGYVDAAFHHLLVGGARSWLVHARPSTLANMAPDALL